MRLRKQPVPIQFSGGVDTKTDPKQVPPTRLLDLQNGIFDRATTIRKRNGYVSLASAVDSSVAPIAGLVGLATRGSELLAFNGGRAYSRRSSSSTWTDTGEVCSTIVSDRVLARTGTQQTMPDHATNGGITVLAWEDNRGGVWYSVIESTSGRILVTDTQLDAAGISPRCCPCGDRLHVMWANAAGRHVMIVVVDPMFPTTISTPSVLADGLSPTNPVYDVCVTSVDAGVAWTGLSPTLLAWAVDSGGYSVGYVHASGVIGSALTGLPASIHAATTITGPIAVAFERQQFTSCAVLYETTGQVMQASFFTTSNLSSLADVPVSIGTAAWLRCCGDYNGTLDGNGHLVWAAECSDPITADHNFVQNGTVNDGGAIDVAAAGRIVRGHSLLSRAYYDNGDVYCAVVHAVKYFPYVAVLRMSGDVWGARTITAARLLPGLSTGAPTRHHVASVHAVSPDAKMLSRQHAVALGYRIQLSSSNGDQFGEAGIRLTTIDFANANAYQTAQLGAGLYMAGGLMLHYDGARWAEAGFHAAPDVSSVLSGTDGGGGSITAGTYGYKLMYEEIDNAGEWHPGPVSKLFNVVVAGATDTVTIAVPTCRLTAKKNVRISVWRSQQGDASLFNRVTSTDPNVIAGNNRFLANDPTVDTVTFVDAMSDATLLTKEPLYTNGGIFSNDPCPCAGGVIAGGKGRLFWTDPSDPNLVRFSKSIEDDAAMAESVGLTIRCDPYGGAIVAIGILDDAVIVLKQTAIHIFGGPGPDADGGRLAPENAFSPVQLLTSDVGCSGPKGVVQSPIGIMFPTTKGIVLLGRDRQIVTEVGDPVFAYKDQIIARATLLPDRYQIVFLTADDTGRTLLYDYKHKQWSTFTNHLGKDAIVLDGVYHYLRTDGRVFRETPGLYADDNAHIPMRIETAWIKFLPYLQGWQKVLWAYFLGAHRSNHVLGVRYRLDYQDAWSTQYLLDVDTNYAPSLYGAGSYGVGAYGGAGGASGTVYQRRLHLNQRCQSIQFRIEDVEATTDFGASFELSELLLIGGILANDFKPGAARSG